MGNRYGIAIQSLSYSPLLTDEVSQSPLSEMLPIGNVKWDKPGGITWDWTLWSRERREVQGAHAVPKAEGNTGCSDIARYRSGLAWSETPSTYTSSLHRNREIPRLAWADGGTGPRCESQGSTTAMNGCGKSDRSIVPKKRRTRAGETPVGGGCGGKWPDRGESDPANQVPNTASERPATRGGEDTAGRATTARHYPRQEPSAVVPHAGICAGGAG